MGLAASQGRYLCLTARMSDLVFEGQQISQQRLALATANQEASEKYNEAMNNTIMQVVTAQNGTQRLTYDVLTNQDPFSGLCMRVVDLNGNVVVPSDNYGISLNAKSVNEKGDEEVINITDSETFIKKFLPNLSGDEQNKLKDKSLLDLKDKYLSENPDSKITFEVHNLKKDGEGLLFDDNCLDPEYLQRMLTSGEWLIQQAAMSEDSEWEDVLISGSSIFSEVYDTSDDAAAEAEYEASIQEIQKKDKILELRLEQVQTEEKAVETEIDSIKDVIKNNIDNSFKTFA